MIIYQWMNDLALDSQSDSLQMFLFCLYIVSIVSVRSS